MGVFAGTERQCTEDEHDDEDEHDSLIRWSRLSVGSSGLRWHGKSRQENEFAKVMAQ
jgi:hypothetical protein